MRHLFSDAVVQREPLDSLGAFGRAEGGVRTSNGNTGIAGYQREIEPKRMAEQALGISTVQHPLSLTLQDHSLHGSKR